MIVNFEATVYNKLNVMLKLISIFSVVSFPLPYAKIFKCCGIQNIILTPDKELNILIYRMNSYVII